MLLGLQKYIRKVTINDISDVNLTNNVKVRCLDPIKFTISDTFDVNLANVVLERC